jgi:hypothetical protein
LVLIVSIPRAARVSTDIPDDGWAIELDELFDNPNAVRLVIEQTVYTQIGPTTIRVSRAGDACGFCIGCIEF